MKKFFLLAAIVSAASPAVSTAAITSYDQFILELINRARLDPLAEAARLNGVTFNANGGPSTYNGELNEGVPSASTISTTPKQALAFDPSLNTAALRHTTDMLTNMPINVLSHTGTDGSTMSSRVTDSGYLAGGSGDGLGENIAGGSFSGTMLADAERMHNLLFIDPNYDDRGHRINIMNGDFESIGLSFMEQGGQVRLTQNFGRRNDNISYITGVAYDDTNANAFFTPGEELTNVTITAFEAGTNSEVASTNTGIFGTGGYTLGLENGIYDLVFSGALGERRIDGVTLSSSNLKFDYTNSAVTPVPLPASAFLMIGGLASLRLWQKRKQASLLG